MKRWLQSLGENERAVKVVVWLFAVLVGALGVTLAYNSGASGELERYALPRWLYVVFGVPSFFLLLVFMGLRSVEKESVLPLPTAEELEQERLRQETAKQEAAEDYRLARQAENDLLELLKRESISVVGVRQSPMAQDMAGLLYMMEAPLRLTKEAFARLPHSRVLSVKAEQQGDSYVIEGFEISSPALHTYATFFVGAEHIK